MTAIPDDGFENEPDEDLLTMMTWADDPTTCRGAFAAFYRRHAPFVNARCRRAYLENGLNRQDVEDLVSETFLRARRRASTFQPSSSGDSDYRRRRVLAWLFTIARRIANDVFRGRQSHPQLLVEPDKLEDMSQGAPPAPTEHTLLMQRALVETLTEREREILLVTMQYYDPERVHQRLPDDIAADLARRFSTTSDNLRKIRMRALEKIRVYIEQALPDSMTAG